MGMEIEFIEQDELFDGLLTLTGGNIGLSHQLLKKVIQKTEYEIKTTLKEFADNIDRETRLARRRGAYALNRNMHLSANHPTKPVNTAGHHIAALTDPRAKKSLEILFKWGIDFNDEINGVHLPRFNKHVPHKNMPNAIAHSQTHTDEYHANVVTMLRTADSTATSKEDLIKALREIAIDLQAGDFPIDDLIG